MERVAWSKFAAQCSFSEVDDAGCLASELESFSQSLHLPCQKFLLFAFRKRLESKVHN